MKATLLVVAFAGVLALTACGGNGGGGATADPVAGERVFSEHCARCHTLEEAGAKGTRAADLDIIRPTYEQVSSCVTYGIRGEMPAFGRKRTLTRKQIRDVATFVSRATRPNNPPIPGLTCGP